MDELRSKLGKLFGGGGKGFRGQGHVLGSASASSGNNNNTPPAPNPRLPTTAAPSGTSRNASLHPAAPPSASVAGRVDTTSTRTTTTAHSAEQPTTTMTTTTSPGESHPALLGSSKPPQVTEAAEAAVAVLVSSGEGAPAVTTLRKVFGNIASDPHNVKFHRLRMGNPKVQETVTGVPGGLELLVAGGFDVVFESSEDGGEEGWAVWQPSHENLAALRGCLQLMDATFPRPQPIPVVATPLTAAAPAGPRKTRVFLPNPNHIAKQDPGEKFYTRSTAEVAADARARAAQRERDGMLTTKAWKEKQKSKVVHTRASVRVRMPDGLMLEGEFGAKEPVDRIFSWVAGALRHPWGQFELVLVHKPIKREGATATVAGQDLCPSALLSFRWIDKDPELQEGSSLNNSMITAAVPFEASL